MRTFVSFAGAMILLIGCQEREKKLPVSPIRGSESSIQIQDEAIPIFVQEEVPKRMEEKWHTVTNTVRFPEGAGSEMLCPFTIDVYPVTFRAGDLVYIRMNFINTKDHAVFAPATRVTGDLKSGILTYYFSDNMIPGRGNEYVWKTYNGMGDLLGSASWEKISPNEKGLTQHEILHYQHTASLKCWDMIKMGEKEPRWGVKMDGVAPYAQVMEGRLKIVLDPKLPAQIRMPSILTQLHVIAPHILCIVPRPPEEMELIETFMENKARRDLLGLNSGRQFGATKEEMQDFRDKISPGTLKNYIQFHIFLNEFMQGIDEKYISEYIKVLDEMEQWLGTLHELERECLQIYARWLLTPIIPRELNSLHDKCDSVFGKVPPIPGVMGYIP